MLELRNLALRRGDKPLIEQATLRIHPGQKVGVIGANGSGKSSLFALLLGELSADQGDFALPSSWVIAHVAQETPASSASALDFVLDGDAELRLIEGEIASAETAGNDGMRLGELHGRFEQIEGYSAPARAARLLAGLGFSDPDSGQPVDSFSGGWRVRLNLAQALMCRSDLLLLDEPTNHLDLDAVIWLEQWLRDYPGTLLLVSHDRDFLDRVCDHTAHLHDRRLRLYRGNYSAFEQQYAAQRLQQQAAYHKQQDDIARLSRFVERFRAKATKARQAQSRLKTLARMELTLAVQEVSPFRFAFRQPERLPNPLLKLGAVAVGYAEKAVLQGLKLTLQPGTRLGLLGPNGAGKSTLIKLLAGELAPLTGDYTTGQGLNIGYFAQHQLEQLRPDQTPVQHLQRLDPAAKQQSLRDFLGGFGFIGEHALRPVAPFSGGEKARLALALLVWRRPNLLLLDEPTNHLDLDMRHALNLALQEFPGSLIVVSHDRHLLASVCDDFLLLANGKLQRFDGDLDDYRSWLQNHRRESADTARSASATARNPASTSGRRAEKRLQAEQRNRLAAIRRPLQKRLQTAEKRLEALAHEGKEIEQKLACPELYEPSNKPELTELLRRQGEIRREQATLEEDWLALQGDIDSIALP